jgi:hypothetical protein
MWPASAREPAILRRRRGQSVRQTTLMARTSAGCPRREAIEGGRRSDGIIDESWDGKNRDVVGVMALRKNVREVPHVLG